MAQSLLERVRAALAPEYDVERELGAGGMGAVYLARDVTLERHVAVKVLRPEHATATAAERFLREARIVAQLSHPNVVPVHAAGEADGLFYYVMDHVEGENLCERLRGGPLSEAEVVKLGHDLLEALEAVHARGVIHRDVKPSNIFLIGDRVLLGDFGIAKVTDTESTALTGADQQVGTPAYMPPEQASGEVSARTDLYAVGMVLYEATTGRRWSVTTSPDEADWSEVSPALSRVLCLALAWSPDDRYEDAAALREALVGIAARKPGIPGAVKLAGAVVVVIVAAVAGRELVERLRPAERLPPRDLAILPFDLAGAWEVGIDGQRLANLVARELGGTPDISVVPDQIASVWWDSITEIGDHTSERYAAARLNARYAAHAEVFRSDNRLAVQLRVFNAAGVPVAGFQPRELELSELRPHELSKEIALELANVVLGEERPELRGRISDDWDAVKEFLQGDEAFSRGAWRPAVKHYEAAVARDSTFVLAWWYMANAWRWLGQSGPYDKDFQQLHDLYGKDLGPVDSLLMAAQLAPAGTERLRLFRQARDLDPLNYFAAYLHGEELFNRGALWGQPLDSALKILREAVVLNDRWASAYVHLAWANIRMGREEEARRYLERLEAIAAAPEEVGWLNPLIFRHAFRERFEPETAAASRESLFQVSGPELLQRLSALSRFANAVDVPQGQLEVGQVLIAASEASDRFRADGHTAVGLALVTLGRGAEALAHFDSVAVLWNTPAARLQAAQWRVLPSALGLALADSLTLQGRASLEALARDRSVQIPAAWTLALDAFAKGDSVRFVTWAARVAGRSEPEAGRPLEQFLRALDAAAHGRYGEALDLSERLVSLQVRAVPLRGGSMPAQRLGDPFARAALHLMRGEWFQRIGELEAAEREFLWYEAVDLDGYPVLQLPQAGEIDWAFGTYGRFKRGLVLMERGELEQACYQLRRAAELWSGAEPELVDLVGEAREASRQACE